MPRIKLAHWHDGHQPGEEIGVSDAEFAALQRDGRVAETVQTPREEPPAPQQEGEAQPAPVAEQQGRRRR
jgi:hypothetical protein